MKRIQTDFPVPFAGTARAFRVAFCFAMGALLWQSAADSRASMIFDSGTEVSFSGTVVGNTNVQDSPAGDPTTVTLESGGDLSGQTIVQGSSELIIDGGSVGSVSGDLLVGGDATVRLDDGIVFQQLRTASNSQAIIRGGTVFGQLGATGASSIEVRGGTFGGSLLATQNSGVLTVYGQNFALDGVPIGPGPLTSDGVLTGTLQYKDPINNSVLRTGGGQIFIVEAPLIPEPTTLALLATLATGGLLARRR